MSFDESDKVLMAQVAESIVKVIPKIFPESLENSHIKISLAHKTNSSDLAPYLSLIGSTLGPLYSLIVGRNWREEKLVEMSEIGLIYVSYHSEEITGFLSFMLVLEEGEKKLYLFEIHINPKYQHSGLGSRLMGYFHQLAEHLNRTGNPNLSCRGTSLTVFAKNSIAYEWYKKLGYIVADHSPQDKLLRNSIIKPDYYILTRPI